MRLSESLGAPVQVPVKQSLVTGSHLRPVLNQMASHRVCVIRVFSLVLFKTGVFMNEMVSCSHGWVKGHGNESAGKKLQSLSPPAGGDRPAAPSLESTDCEDKLY